MNHNEVYREILELWEQGLTLPEIAEKTATPAKIVQYCLTHPESIVRNSASALLKVLRSEIKSGTQIFESYAYLLGMYLGDGSIVKMRRVYRLRVSLDAKYPNIISECTQAIQLLFPENQIGHVQHINQGKLSHIDVSLYRKDLPLFFPQHALGKKHQRKIELKDWQQRIIDACPLAFWKGLYQSDGSRFDNIVNGKAYPRYQFSNTSTDIVQIFSNTCDRLGLHWTTKTRPTKHNTLTDIYISKRKDVEYLDSVIGPKS